MLLDKVLPAASPRAQFRHDSLECWDRWDSTNPFIRLHRSLSLQLPYRASPDETRAGSLTVAERSTSLPASSTMR